MKKFFLFFATLFVVALLFTACNKEENTPATDDNVATSEDVTTLQNLIQDTEDEVEQQLETRTDDDDECPIFTVTPEDGSFPRTVTIDYGPDGCDRTTGRVRKGKIIVTLTDNILNEGAVRTISFENFSVDGVQVEGSKTLTNNGNRSFTRVVDIAIEYPNGQTASWSGTQTLTQIEGMDTPTLRDNVFELSGIAEGINRNGTPWTLEITTPLVKNKFCPWIQQGVLTLTVNGKERSIDYGDGSCDFSAAVTLANGQTIDIFIKPWWL